MRRIGAVVLLLSLCFGAGYGYGAYQTKIYRDQSGNRETISSGGTMRFLSGSTLTLSGATIDSIRTGSVKTSGYLIANGASILRSGAAVTGAISATTTITGAGILNTGKYYGLTAATAWSDTAGWTGPKAFIFAAGDTIYIYTAAHTIKKFPAI